MQQEAFATDWVKRNATDAALIADLQRVARNCCERFKADARATGVIAGEQNSFVDAALLDALAAASRQSVRPPEPRLLDNDNRPPLRLRTAGEVIDDHLRLRLSGEVEEDLRRNYSSGTVLITACSSAQGHGAIRESERGLPDCNAFEVVERHESGSVILLVWSASGCGRERHIGAETYIVEDGQICLQMVHCRTADSKPGLSR